MPQSPKIRAPMLPIFGSTSRDPESTRWFADSLASAHRLVRRETRRNPLVRDHGFTVDVFQPRDFLSDDPDARQPYFVYAIGKAVGTKRTGRPS